MKTFSVSALFTGGAGGCAEAGAADMDGVAEEEGVVVSMISSGMGRKKIVSSDGRRQGMKGELKCEEQVG